MYGKPADIFSLGIMFYEIVYRRTPFDDLDTPIYCRALQDLDAAIQFPKKDQSGRPIPDIVIEVMKTCVQQNPAKRPTIDRLLKSRCFERFSLSRRNVDSVRRNMWKKLLFSPAWGRVWMPQVKAAKGQWELHLVQSELDLQEIKKTLWSDVGGQTGGIARCADAERSSKDRGATAVEAREVCAYRICQLLLKRLNIAPLVQQCRVHSVLPDPRNAREVSRIRETMLYNVNMRL